MEDSGNDKYRAPALDKGLDIIELLAARSHGLSQKDIASALGRSPNEIYRMLTTLLQRGYIARDDKSDLFALSLKMFSLAQFHPPMHRLLAHAAPLMQAAVQRSWQSCHIGMEDNGMIVVVASHPSPGNWGLALRTGSVIGLANTGTGRVLAAFRSPEEQNVLLDNHRLALGEPKPDRVQLESRLEEIRKRGYEQASSGTTQGVIDLAFPVFDSFSRAIAVVNCPYLSRLDEVVVPDLDEVVEMYKALAANLTDYFGGAAPTKFE